MSISDGEEDDLVCILPTDNEMGGKYIGSDMRIPTTYYLTHKLTRTQPCVTGLHAF